MRIEIQGLEFPLTAALLHHTERRLRFALTRTSDRIKRVVVRSGVTDGPRGGEDKFYRMQVVLEHAPPVLNWNVRGTGNWNSYPLSFSPRCSRSSSSISCWQAITQS